MGNDYGAPMRTPPIARGDPYGAPPQMGAYPPAPGVGAPPMQTTQVRYLIFLKSKSREAQYRLSTGSIHNACYFVPR
jgi:hypothetical protein